MINKGLWNVSLVLIVIGLLAFAAGIILQVIRREKEQAVRRVQARVVELVLDENTKGSAYGLRNSYYPVFEYYADGKLIKVRHKEGAWPSRYKVNDRVSLLYDPEEPESVLLPLGV